MTDLDLAQRVPLLLAGRTRRSFAGSQYRPAAVLVPFLQYEDGWRLLLTLRAADLNHGGQMAFPGGAIDPEDRNAVEAALREAHEELGISPAQVEVWGTFDDYAPTSTGFYATPVVAELPAGYPFQPNPAEVEAIVPIPLRWLVDPANLRIERRPPRPPLPAVNYVWQYGPYKVWGFTSRILKGLLDVLELEQPS